MKAKGEVLRAHLAQGAGQAERGEFAEGYSIEKVISELDREICRLSGSHRGFDRSVPMPVRSGRGKWTGPMQR